MNFFYYIFECLWMVLTFNSVKDGVLKSTGQPVSWIDNLVGLGVVWFIVVSYVIIREIIKNRFKSRSDEKKRDEFKENK